MDLLPLWRAQVGSVVYTANGHFFAVRWIDADGLIYFGHDGVATREGHVTYGGGKTTTCRLATRAEEDAWRGIDHTKQTEADIYAAMAKWGAG